MQLTVRDAARLLKISEKTVYRWIRKGAIPAYRLNGQFRFDKDELQAWIAERKVPLAPELYPEAEAEQEPLPTLAEALRAGGVFYRIGGQDTAGVLQAVVEAMPLPDDVERGFLYHVLLARESMGSTAIGEGIAIPHVRNPIVLQLAQPMMMLCFLEHPVDFGAVDGKPVDTVFTLLSPTVRAHLHLLSRLAFVLRDAGFRAVLARKGESEEVHAALARAQSAMRPDRPAPGREP